MRQLYYYPLCGFSRTALLALAEKKLDFSMEVTKFWDRSSGLLDLNSFGRLPVLIDLNGSIIAGIYALMEYLEEAYNDVRLLGDDLTEKAEARRIIQGVNEDFAAEVSIPLVFEKDIKRHFPKAGGMGGAPSSATMRQIREATATFLTEFERIAERRNWLAGKTLSLADLTTAAHLSVVDYLGGITWKRFPALTEWYVRLKSRPSFRRLLADRVSGLPPAPHYSDLDF